MTEKEFNHIVFPLADPIYSFALHLCGNPADAADLTQDVLSKLWEGRKEWKHVRNPKAWALTITRNLYLDLLKKQKPLYDDAQVEKCSPEDRDLQKWIENKDTLEAVNMIIGTLPAHQREVMVLREIEGLEFDEIAQITGLGINNIRVLLSRARSKIKEILIKKYKMSIYEG